MPVNAQPAQLQASPWYRFPMVWLVLAGPALVIVASIVTLGLAIGHPDPVVGDRQALRDKPASEWPAVQARNHAAQPTP